MLDPHPADLRVFMLMSAMSLPPDRAQVAP
jgi:hypothetical protein